ncbi:MAG: MFS transporter [Gammaproteobacteria bacterium]|nr:MFS transporter [Gammaproteobacteria bacterium]
MNKIGNGNWDATQEWKSLSLLGLGLCFIGFGRYVIPILFAGAIEDIELAPDNIGDVGGITSIVLGVFAIFAGRVSDEIGHRKILIAAIILFSLLLGISGTVQALIVLIVIQLLAGALNGCYVPTSFATVAAVSKPSRRGLNLGLLQAFALLGRLLAIVIGVLLSVSGSWSSVFWIIAVLGLVIGALMHFLLREHKEPQAGDMVDATKERICWGELLRSRNIVVCIFATLCATNCVFVLGTYVLVFTDDAATFGLLTAMIVFGGYLGQISWPALSDNSDDRGRRPHAILGFIGAAVSAFWLLGIADSTPSLSFLPLFVCSYFCFGNMALISGPITAESAPAGLVSSTIGVVVGSVAILGGLAVLVGEEAVIYAAFDPSGEFSLASGVSSIAAGSVILGIPLCMLLKGPAPLETGEKPETEDNLEDQTLAKSGKNPVVAYALWILLFPLGAHRFYLGRWASAAALLHLSLIFFLSRFILVSLPFPIFLDPEGVFREFYSILDVISRPLLAIIIFWWLFDAFRIRAILKSSLANSTEGRALAKSGEKPETEDSPEGRVSAKSGKNLVVAYVLWFFLGSLGAHRFYLGRWRSAIVLILLLLLAIISYISLVGFLIGLLLQLVIGIWLLIDAFRMPKMARRR